MPRDRILYILGEGFFAALGLPVIRDFLFNGKDERALAPDRFTYFQEVFRLVDGMATVKNFYDADLFNIEEVLSVLEMQAEVSGTNQRSLFVRFIKDVVQYYTPPFADPGDCTAGNYDDQFINVRPGESYICFVASLFKAALVRHQTVTGPGNRGRFAIQASSDADPRYSVMTLNYDTVLENACEYLCRNAEAELRFYTDMESPDPDWERGPYLAKLHGSVDTETIVPPTWSKGVSDEIRDAWRLAHNLLAAATSIRIIGYSLPQADAYVRYLLKSAALVPGRLKSIDILCLDEDGLARPRYESFLRFPNCRFQSMDAGYYLSKLSQYPRRVGHDPDRREFVRLEDLHRDILQNG
jgi:hypothetical protein